MQTGHGTAATESTSGTEDAIRAMMAKIIGIPAVASGDNFFGVGGT